MSEKNISGYELSRAWFDWCFENPDLIKPTHTALYFFAIEHWNRMGWSPKFGLPTQMAMDAIGVKNWRTYASSFEDLVKWGFFEVIQKSKNQYSATVIAIVKNTKANTGALTKAHQKHIQKHSSSTAVINKHRNIEHINHRTEKVFSPPSIDEVISYFQEKGYFEEVAKRAFEYYSVANWVDAKGNQVKNWKQKMNSVWFKPENKKQNSTNGQHSRNFNSKSDRTKQLAFEAAEDLARRMAENQANNHNT